MLWRCGELLPSPTRGERDSVAPNLLDDGILRDLAGKYGVGTLALVKWIKNFSYIAPQHCRFARMFVVTMKRVRRTCLSSLLRDCLQPLRRSRCGQRCISYLFCFAILAPTQ